MAVAGILQVIVLAVTAYLVLGYLRETERLRIATQQQVDKSQALVEAAQRQLGLAREDLVATRAQVAIAQNQLEAQIRPALVVFPRGNFQIANVGSGPGLNLKLVEVAQGARIDWELPSNIADRLTGSFVALGELHAKDSTIPQGFFEHRGRDLHIFRESLSGRKYATVLRFGDNGTLTDTRFAVRE